MIESGPHVEQNDSFVQPARCLSHLRPDNPILKVHVSKVSDYLGGRPQVVTCAHAVGGGSSINCTSHSLDTERFYTGALLVTMYNRAIASDFDDWEAEHKNPGWGAKDIVPLLKKVAARLILVILMLIRSLDGDVSSGTRTRECSRLYRTAQGLAWWQVHEHRTRLPDRRERLR